MPTNWRTLFDSIGVPWTDRGPNARRGNVNIQCPWCGQRDPSEHLLISETDAGYYCHRDPTQHRGRNFVYMLQEVLPGKSRREIIDLLNEHTSNAPVQAYEKPKAIPTDIEQRWSRFLPAEQSGRCLDYLYSRGFEEPERVTRRYDLRFARNGEWAMRLLIPIVDEDGTVITWTGRALRDKLTLRYLTQPVDYDGLIHVPRPMRANGIVVEGPMDALKIAVATEFMPISPIAMMGAALAPQRMVRIQSALHNTTRLVFVTLDKGVRAEMVRTLRGYLANSPRSLYVRILRVPEGYGDPGAMPVTVIRQWLAEAIG